jgi:hypothetical protein
MRGKKCVIYVTPDPSFPGFDGADQWMASLLNVFHHVLILGHVAASNITANQAHAQVDPTISQCDAIPTHVRIRFSDLNEM